MMGQVELEATIGAERRTRSAALAPQEQEQWLRQARGIGSRTAPYRARSRRRICAGISRVGTV